MLISSNRIVNPQARQVQLAITEMGKTSEKAIILQIKAIPLTVIQILLAHLVTILTNQAHGDNKNILINEIEVIVKEPIAATLIARYNAIIPEDRAGTKPNKVTKKSNRILKRSNCKAVLIHLFLRRPYVLQLSHPKTHFNRTTLAIKAILLRLNILEIYLRLRRP